MWRDTSRIVPLCYFMTSRLLSRQILSFAFGLLITVPFSSPGPPGDLQSSWSLATSVPSTVGLQKGASLLLHSIKNSKHRPLPSFLVLAPGFFFNNFFLSFLFGPDTGLCYIDGSAMLTWKWSRPTFWAWLKTARLHRQLYPDFTSLIWSRLLR